LHVALTEALSAADANMNLADFDRDGNGWIDMITFIHSGYAAECMFLLG
jgi:hypothetical protein